jgi:hypothetical protein
VRLESGIRLKLVLDTLLSPDNFYFLKIYVLEFTSSYLARDIADFIAHLPTGRNKEKRKRNPNIGLCHAHQDMINS